MTDDATWTFDELPYSLNQMLRAHWATRKQIKDFYAMHFRAIGKVAPEPCELTVTWRVVQEMDWDNCAARFKLIGDAMVEAGVLSDDNPRVIRAFHVKQIRVKHRQEQGFTVEATPLLYAIPSGCFDPDTHKLEPYRQEHPRRVMAEAA